MKTDPNKYLPPKFNNVYQEYIEWLRDTIYAEYKMMGYPEVKIKWLHEKKNRNLYRSNASWKVTNE